MEVRIVGMVRLLVSTTFSSLAQRELLSGARCSFRTTTTMANPNPDHDMDPSGRWFTRYQLGTDVWREGTLHARNNPDHEMYLGCGPVDSRTGLNERRRVLFDMESKAFSDLLGRRFANLVDDFPDTKDGKRQRKNGREALKLKMRHALKESDNRLAAAFSLTTTTTRVVSVLGVEHTEASTATATTPTEQFQMMELMSASASNMNAVASILDAERVERIAGQVQHKAWVDQNTIGIGKAHERIDIHGQRIDILERTIEALMNASASNIDDVARTSASSLDAERVERIAGQVQHKALLTDTLSELERPTKGSTSMVKGLQSRAHN